MLKHWKRCSTQAMDAVPPSISMKSVCFGEIQLTMFEKYGKRSKWFTQAMDTVLPSILMKSVCGVGRAKVCQKFGHRHIFFHHPQILCNASYTIHTTLQSSKSLPEICHCHTYLLLNPSLTCNTVPFKLTTTSHSFSIPSF